MPVTRRVLTGLSVMLVTFTLLVAGTAVVHQATFVSPLARTMRALGVRHYVVSPAVGGETPHVTVFLPNGVDLEQEVETITGALTPLLGRVPLVSADGPAERRLAPALADLSLPVWQAAATGDFAAMASVVQSKAHKLGVRASLAVDTTYVYLTVSGPGREGDAYLVVPRGLEPPSATTPAQRGEP